MKKLMTVLIAVAPLALSSCRTAMLYDPQRISIQGASREQMRNAITQALAGRGWVISDERPGAIDATLNVRRHTARITIAYDEGSFDIGYLGSTNLKYDKRASGTEKIHKNYNSWIHNLVQDISAKAGRGS